MAIQGNVDLTSLRARLAASSAGVVKEPDAGQSPVGKVLMNYFPYHYRRVMSGLHKAGLLDKVRIDYVERDMRRIDFAWVEKKIGLRVSSWPEIISNHEIPDFIYSDSALRESGWLMLSINPHSPNFDDQLGRVVSVVKRVGAPKNATT